MSEEFKKAYSELDIEDKRNELNNEMKVALKMLDIIKQTIGVEIDSEDAIRNYDTVSDNTLSESEMLDILYFDFHVIQKNILDVAESIISKQI